MTKPLFILQFSYLDILIITSSFFLLLFKLSLYIGIFKLFLDSSTYLSLVYISICRFKLPIQLYNFVIVSKNERLYILRRGYSSLQYSSTLYTIFQFIYFCKSSIFLFQFQKYIIDVLPYYSSFILKVIYLVFFSENLSNSPYKRSL